ncbi:hypothetical protein [Salipiger sp. 1_MG-2023]|uniref:hypothetical protein n=1 Tax=Salipiger sp. 1_MG-2023 TaxID=3062665 RepID=UPI0026E3A961|nr:hypothetical protein [Salipiger sp. 1_MG-2023]
MTDRKMSDDGPLAPWFDAARDYAPLASGDWLARMEAMALAEQPAPRAVSRPVPGRRSGWLREALGQLGGWPAMAGLAAACVAGVWLGAVAPSDWTGMGTTDSLISAAEPASAYDYAMLGL